MKDALSSLEKKKHSNKTLNANTTLVVVDESLHETKQHGSPDYPVAPYRINVKEHHMEIVPWHWHKECEYIYIIEGSGEFLVSDDSYILHHGEALLINSEIMHSFHIAPDADNCIFISIVFNPSFLIHPSHTSQYAKYIYPLTQNRNICGYVLRESPAFVQPPLSAATTIYEMNKRQEFGYEIYTKGYLLRIWFNILKEVRDTSNYQAITQDEKISLDEKRTKEAIHFIEEHYAETITLDDIADSIHLSKGECCRCIKRCMHQTPFEYLMRFRVLKSAQLLSDGNNEYSISELAQAVGFNSSSYFNKLFRKYMKCTPSQYRKKMQD